MSANVGLGAPAGGRTGNPGGTVLKWLLIVGLVSFARLPITAMPPGGVGGVLHPVVGRQQHQPGHLVGHGRGRAEARQHLPGELRGVPLVAGAAGPRVVHRVVEPQGQLAQRHGVGVGAVRATLLGRHEFVEGRQGLAQVLQVVVPAVRLTPSAAARRATFAVRAWAYCT